MSKWAWVFLMASVAVWVLMMGIAAAQSDDERSFYMGFTPFPHDVTDDALAYIIERTQSDGDLIAHHLDEGIPWVEALNGEDFSGVLTGELDYRRFINQDHQVYVSITPIDITRSTLAPYHGPQGVTDLPHPWDTYAFNHPDVVAAYLAYAQRVIEYLNPDYLAIGIEANGLLTNTPDAWPDYLELHQVVYEQLKVDHPDLPIMVSLIAPALLEGYTEEHDYSAQMKALEDIMPYSDYFALSLYPYMSVYTTEQLPDDLFEQLRELSDKPMAIAETGYPADSFSITLPDGVYTFESNPHKQAEYMALLLNSAQAYDMQFVVNFVLRDYDAVWEALGRDETLAIWRDTGIYDEDGNLRPAGEIWMAWLSRSVGDTAVE